MESKIPNINELYLEAANTYRGINGIIGDANNGIFHAGVYGYYRQLYRLHKEFYTKALLILLHEGDDDLDFELYWKEICEERREIARICHGLKTDGLCAMVRRRIYASQWASEMGEYVGAIFSDWGIDTETNRLIYSPE